jgi:hypothetical protein
VTTGGKGIFKFRRGGESGILFPNPLWPGFLHLPGFDIPVLK